MRRRPRTAAPTTARRRRWFLIGDTVKGGFYGEAPSLSALDRGGSLKYTVDFRQVYQEILESHLQVDSQEVLGKAFERIPAVRTA